MAIAYNTSIVLDGLVFALDPANSRSYSGSGNTVYNVALSSAIGATKTAGLTSTSLYPVTFIAPSDANYLLSDYTLASGTSFTVCMWFKRQATAYWSALFANEVWNSATGYVAYFSSATNLIFSRGGGSSSITYSNAEFASSNFNFYAFVKNPSGTNSVIYINGIGVTSGSIADVTPTKPFLFNNRWLNAGTAPSNADSRQSQFSNIAVYNRALTAREVLQNYNATKKRYGL
jgi:hypothetical protein